MTVGWILLSVAGIPFIYYALALYSTVRFFRTARRENVADGDFAPPVSCLKPAADTHRKKTSRAAPGNPSETRCPRPTGFNVLLAIGSCREFRTSTCIRKKLRMAVLTPTVFHMFAAIALRVGNHEHTVYMASITISGSNG